MSTYKRIKEKRWQRRWEFFKKIIVSILLGMFLGVGFGILHKPWFAFGTIYITGTEKISKNEILELTKLQEPANLFLVNSNNVETILSNDLRIKSVKTRYELPNIFHIDLVEAQPLFYVISNYGFVSVREDGIIISAEKNIKEGNAIILSGVSVNNHFIGDKIEDENIKLVVEFLNNIDSNLRNQISEFNIYDEKKSKIIDLMGRNYILGEVKNIPSKARVFSAIIKEVLEKNIAVEFVDLSYSKPYIKIRNQDN